MTPSELQAHEIPAGFRWMPESTYRVMFTPNDGKKLLRDSLVAMLTMLVFVYFGCLSVVATGTWLTSTGNSVGVARLLPIAFSFGLSATALVYTAAHLSGGHLNPCITLCLMLLRKISIGRGLTYFVMQLLGA